MYTKKIYFTGGSFHELQKLFQMLPGVVAVKTGYINAAATPDYDSVLWGKIPAIMGVEVVYNPKKIDISKLIDVLFAVISPYIKDKYGECEGEMYRAGVYYSDAEDAPQVELCMNFIANRGKPPAATGANLTMNDPNSDRRLTRKCYATCGRLKTFHEAEASHQDFLNRHPYIRTYIDFAKLNEYLKF